VIEGEFTIQLFRDFLALAHGEGPLLASELMYPRLKSGLGSKHTPREHMIFRRMDGLACDTDTRDGRKKFATCLPRDRITHH
jgi:hypothetical protein